MIPVSTLLEIRLDYREKAKAIQEGDAYPFYSWCCQNVEGYKTLAGNLRFRIKLLKMAADDIEFKNDLWAMCKRDMLFYINTFGFTSDPRLIPNPTEIPFITYDFQDVALAEIKEAIEKGFDELTEKSRDMGASWMYLTVFQWFWQFVPYTTFRLLSRNEDLVDRADDPDCLFWKIEFLINHQPKWFQPNYKDVHLLHLNYDNNSTQTGCSTTGDAVRGGRCTAMLPDEFAAVPDGHGMLRSTRDVTKCRLFNSTHQGAATAFYLLSKGSIRKLVIHWSVHPEKAKGLYHSSGGRIIRHDNFKGEVTVNGETYDYPNKYPFRTDGKLRSPWYDNECDRAAHPMEIAQELDIDPFSSDFQYYDPIMINEIEAEHVCDPVDEGMLEFDEDSLEPLEFVHGANGHLKLWVNLDGNGKVPWDIEVGCGVDISAGTGASNSTATFVNLQTGEKIAEYANPYVKPEYFAHEVIALCRFFNDAFLNFDASGPTGEVFSAEILRIGWRSMYYRRNEEGTNQKVSDKPGMFLNPKQRSRLFGLYRRHLKDRTFIQRSHEANQECLEIIQKSSNDIVHSSSTNNIDPSGAGASHSDRVIADALAAKLVEFLDKTPKKGDGGTPPPKSYAARKLRREKKEREKDLW